MRVRQGLLPSDGTRELKEPEAVGNASIMTLAAGGRASKHNAAGTSVASRTCLQQSAGGRLVGESAACSAAGASRGLGNS